MNMKWFVRIATVVSVLASTSAALAYDDVHPYPISHKRAEALMECNYEARLIHPDFYDGHNRTAYYRACMYSHGEPE